MSERKSRLAIAGYRQKCKKQGKEKENLEIYRESGVDEHSQKEGGENNWQLRLGTLSISRRRGDVFYCARSGKA